jgi:hypothetical protein
MKKILLIAFFAFLLFPISYSFSQFSDEPSEFALRLTSTSPFYFKDENGYTIILGEIQNMRSSYYTNVKITGVFLDDSEKLLDSSIGSSVIEVIPPFGIVPYMIKSNEPNAGITQIKAPTIGGFNSSPTKNEDLKIESEILEIGEEIKISGIITNQGLVDTNQTKVHLVLHDSFTPTTIRGYSTIEIQDVIASGSSVDFEINIKSDVYSSGYKILAESENYNSNIQNVEIIPAELLTKLVRISELTANDDEGNRLSPVPLGSRVNIESKILIQYSEDQETYNQPFRYYVQVKESTTATVEFIGIIEGNLDPSNNIQFPNVKWVPQSTGLYLAETFVWDTNAVPLASKGPIILILVT